MHWVTKTAAATGFAAIALLGAAVPASAVQDDPACDWLGWRHPACAGGYYDNPLPKSPAGGWNNNPFPGGGGQMVPNTDGGLSLPGTPGAI